MSALGHSTRLARIDVSRMLRKHANWRGSSSSILSLAMYVVLLGGGTLGGGYLGLRMGESLAAGGELLGIGGFTVAIARGLLAAFWLVIVLVYVVRALGQRGTLAQPEGVLTVVPTNQALVGVLFAEYVYFLLWAMVPAMGLGIGLAAGGGVVWPVVAVPVAVAAAGVAAVAVAYPLGLGIRHVATRFEFVARNKVTIIVVVVAGYFLALSTGAWNELMVRLFEPMQQSPVGWYADVLLLGTPSMSPSMAYAGAAIALTAGLALVAVVGGTRIAERHWFSDPALAGTEAPIPTEEAAAPGIERRLAPVFGTKTAALVTLSWRRAKRSPLKLLYAFYPLLVMAGILANIVRSGEVPAYLPFAALVFATWAAGVVFTLNPLGDQGAALASTLLSEVDGRTFVRAHVLAGLIVAVPLGTALTAVVAFLSPVDGATALALVVATPVAMVVSAAFSIGVGMAFPRFEATTVTQSMKTVLPSRWAFVLFTLYLFATAAAAAIVYEAVVREVVAALVSWVLPFGLTVSAGSLYPVAAVALVPLVLAPIVSYRYAVGRFERYTLA
jgi:hypothetical protein